MNGDIGIRYGLVHGILKRLTEIREWFLRQRKYYFFSSSILLVYDAKKLISFVESEKDKNDVAVTNRNPEIGVYFIDFAHAISSAGNMDLNCLESLNKLIYIFEHLSELHEKSLNGKISITKNLIN